MLLPLIALSPAFATQKVAGDADDPAIWVNVARPAASRILGTDKKGGRLYVFDLNGKIVQTLEGLSRPNNVDVLKDFAPGFDLAMVTERDGDRLHAYRIDKTGRLSDVSGSLASPKPMGIALYKDAQGVAWVFVSPKEGDEKGYIGRYRLSLNAGKIDATRVGGVGEFKGGKEIESLAIDRKAGLLWYSDEGYGNRSLLIESGRQTSTRLNPDYKGDQEGIAVWTRGGKTYRAFTNQLEKASRYRVCDADKRLLGEFTLGADSTDGIDACAQNLGPRFPKGIFVAMNSKGKDFLVIGLDKIESALKAR